MWWIVSIVVVAVLIIWRQRTRIGILKSDLWEAENKVKQLEKSIRANRKYELKKEKIDSLLAQEEQENERVVDKSAFIKRVNTVFDLSDENN